MLEFLRKLFGQRSGKRPTNREALAAAVSGREEAGQGLRHSEEEFARLVAGVRDYAVFLLDREGNVRTWNVGAERIKGYRAEEIVGKHFSTFYPKESVSSGWPAHELTVAAATGRFEDEGWRLRKDGSRFWASVVITALRDEAGQVRGFLKITRDLTDRKQADEKLRLSEQRFRLMVEGVRDYAIFMLDPEGRVATWNAGAERTNRYTAEEIIGQHFSKFYPKEDVESGKPARELEIARATGKYEEEGWRLRKDGSRFWASVVITALRDRNGVLRGFGKVTRDMTERKEAEENTRRLIREEAARQAAEQAAEEARRAQQEERRHREQLHVTLNSIGDAVIVTDRDEIITFMNPVAVELTGWQPHEACGQPLEHVFRIINEETRQPVESPVVKVLHQGTVVGLANHTVLVTRDGRELPIDDSGAPIRGEDEAVAGVVLVFRDVTEARKAIEARLHLAAIVESSEDAIISKTLDGLIISWNYGAERLYGYTAQEIVGKPLSLLAPPDHPDELPALMERIRRGERIEHYETVRVRKDGSRIDVALTISPVRNAQGKVVGASKIARDITARKRHEEVLRFLAGASKLLGNLLDVPDTLQKVAELAVPGFADGCAVDLRGADGSPRRVAAAGRLDGEARVSVPLTVGGRDTGVLRFVGAGPGRRFGPDDVRAAEDLAQRTAVAVENARLYGELKEADRQKNEWIAMLAHELRNPLAPIRSALHVMSMPGANGDTVEQARQMTERQVQHMVRLVDDLLDVSRIVRGRIELRKEPTDLASAVARGAETVRPMIDAEGQQLIVSVPPEPLRLQGDPTRLAQVVSNLLHNAAKFSPPSGRIWLTLERQGNEAVLRVRDEGAGIPADLLPRVFDLFTQGGQRTERSQGGLGIGLTVVRKLVELHGGSVSVHSEGAGKGTEFVVRLPGLLSVSRAEPVPSSPEPGPEPVARRVLVADDNVDAAESLALLLRLQGHEVRVAHDGPEVLEVIKEFRPDVAFLDIGMPGMDGYEVARRLRQQPGLEHVRLAALTGWGQQEDRRRSAEAGFDHHLVKPVEPEAVEDLLADLERATG